MIQKIIISFFISLLFWINLTHSDWTTSWSNTFTYDNIIIWSDTPAPSCQFTNISPWTTSATFNTRLINWNWDTLFSVRDDWVTLIDWQTYFNSQAFFDSWVSFRWQTSWAVINYSTVVATTWSSVQMTRFVPTLDPINPLTSIFGFNSNTQLRGLNGSPDINNFYSNISWVTIQDTYEGTINNFYWYRIWNINNSSPTAKVNNLTAYWTWPLSTWLVNRAYQSEVNKADWRHWLYFNWTADNYLNGNLWIWVHTPTSRLDIKSTWNTSSTYSQHIQNSSSSTIFTVRDDGQIWFRNYYFPIWDWYPWDVLATNWEWQIYWSTPTTSTWTTFTWATDSFLSHDNKLITVENWIITDISYLTWSINTWTISIIYPASTYTWSTTSQLFWFYSSDWWYYINYSLIFTVLAWFWAVFFISFTIIALSLKFFKLWLKK